ncbi:AAA ATPase midasin [Knufia peltigerae]|uniref:Midasin n=1 Tax=Knufia peltigerae TaxID=1002370 RepID=A0AA38Y953_9EURO|nr:AAA ATPase midasin [Knufia peltigerae]
MEDIAVYCSWGDAQVKKNEARLPPELQAIILQSTGSQYFDALSRAAIIPQHADRLFALYRPLYAELAARFPGFGASPSLDGLVHSVSCLARILPFASYFRRHVKDLLVQQSLLNRIHALEGSSITHNPKDLQSLLLALFRILSFDRDLLAGTAAPTFFSSLLRHDSETIRYLAIQCLCMVMHFADAFSERMVETYVGKAAIIGDWEGQQIDFRVLKLWEEHRWTELAEKVAHVDSRFQHEVPTSPRVVRPMSLTDLSTTTANLSGVILPRSNLPEPPTSSFGLTPTAKRNLKRVGQCLLAEKPILVSGPQGSGKTAVIHEAARALGKLSALITLHLNEQTDAKSLLGIYTSSADGESFTWQAGVLTKAIQQGRWVLIEDIDRAPAEVMGVLRPIIENAELFLPSRKETVRAKDGFRIFATIKSAGRSSSTSGSRQSWLLNPRLWSVVDVASYELSEIETLLRSKYPTIDAFTSTVLQIHEEVSALYKDDPRFRSLQTRSPSLRDLLNWARRIAKRVPESVNLSKSTPIAEATKFHIFKDAVDCYGGYLNDDELHNVVAASIARQMSISPQQMRHCLDDGFGSVVDNGTFVQIGRSSLLRIPSRRRPSQKTPFALTKYAQRTLDRIAASASCSEPCLLVGETGVGKTTLVQHIATLVGQELTVVNLSQQSEVSDLLGGLKPVTTRSLVLPLVEKFTALFEDTFSAKRNEKFNIAISKAVAKQNWPRLMLLWNEAIQLAAGSLATTTDPPNPDDPERAAKRRKLATPKYDALRRRWADFAEDAKRIRAHVERGDKNHTFAFVEGRLVHAVREGAWVLLDEINLATPDALDYIVSLLHNGDDEKPSLLLTEAGNIETIVAHPNFRIFGAMNPATDAGKKDLPAGLRSRFTEIYVPSGDSNLEDLTKIIQSYLGSHLDNDRRAAPDLARAYLDLQKLNMEHKLTDGAGDVPHFSIRSLVRCLLYVLQHSASHGLRRAIYEGFATSFFTVLSRVSEDLALPILEKHLLSNVKNKKSFLSQQPKMPFNGEDFIAFRHHLVKRGSLSPDLQPHYIRTPSVERNLLNLARAASMRRFPILLQGPTSAGKTSMVEYLSKLSGNKFVRINNHEHTDLQEYLGSYVSDADGKLQYREGVLVNALRQGYWIVLDELNLAPSDVLEALNRLLDDNRELLIPESQEIVRPHPNFMLFATQNPAGLYGGRKRLSRAFRNRFLELHFDDIPENELEIILRERAQIPPSFCAQIVAVYKKLSLQRQSSRLFEQRNSFATLRDLFRWTSRSVDDRQQLANHGFMLLAERVREPAERAIVKKTIEETMKVVIDENVLYGLQAIPSSVQSSGTIVWTLAMRRLFVLIEQALKNNEPVLLVGETGCGKTQICQVIAEAFGRPLDIYNAHTNTETGDLIGSQRPIRNRSDLELRIREDWRCLFPAPEAETPVDEVEIDQLIKGFSNMDVSSLDPEAVARTRASIGAYQSMFTWSDGSLIRAMKTGDHFLLDEISLADDSVLERLNSVLEPSRTILLAEKGSDDNLVVAHADFQFLATMNPGGDYGKRELSAALRNRLTEIWVPPLSQEADTLPIVQNKLVSGQEKVARLMLTFAIWFRRTFHSTASDTIPLRDLLAWADFINRASPLGEELAFIHGAFMVYIDSIGANPAGMISIGSQNLNDSRQACLAHLQTLVNIDVSQSYYESPEIQRTQGHLRVGPFALSRSQVHVQDHSELVFDAPTTLRNTMRIVRALQMARPILLEGSPGVGKTAIVTALAQACGKQFTRINLSDQTDLMDLFGADTPSEGEDMGNFSWQDGPLLDAMQNGGWVLLDEMNLASQSVLEGLNSCLDHRREAYIAELDKSFTCHPEFALFAAQNPHHQGGGRKGLPASFVNRFTVVYADSFCKEDLMRICERKFPNLPLDQLEGVVDATAQIDQLVSRSPAFNIGGPWELNLRDVSRWLMLCQGQPTLPASAQYRTIVAERFRTEHQRSLSFKIREQVWQTRFLESFYNAITPTSFQIGTSFITRDDVQQRATGPNSSIAISQLPAANSVISAIKQNWPVILCGPSGSGKTTLLRSLAATCGTDYVEFSMNADVDTMDLVGGFEQYDVRRVIVDLQHKIKDIVRGVVAHSLQTMDSQGLHKVVLDAWQLVDADEISLDELSRVLPPISRAFPELEASVQAIAQLSRTSDIGRSRFVWNDGILVDAIEKGSWLVLDNANLCNPSVLDRLNSLLEPNGVLAVSEHHNAGNARVVKPHPNFRIFMTVDPRYGELSRAMRNRSLEVFMPVLNESDLKPQLIQYPYASSIARLRQLAQAAPHLPKPEDIEPFVYNLSHEEMSLSLNRTTSIPGSIRVKEVLTSMTNFDSLGACRLSSLSGNPSLLYIPQLVALDEPLIQLQIPLDQQIWSSVTAELFTRAWYVTRDMVKIKASLTAAAENAAAISAKDRTVLERSMAANGKSKIFANIPQVFTFAQSCLSALERLNTGSIADVRFVRAFGQISAFVGDMIVLSKVKTMDFTLLQAYVQIAYAMAGDIEETYAEVATAFRKCLDLLTPRDEGLKYGQGLQLMWPQFQPETARSSSQLELQLALETLIARFDAACRSLPQSRASLSVIRSKLQQTYDSVFSSNGELSLLEPLQEAVSELEMKSENGFPLIGKFQRTIDYIRQVTILGDGDVSSSEVQVLTMFSTATPAILMLAGEKTLPFSLNQLASLDTSLLSTHGSGGTEFVAQLCSVLDQPLGTLHHAKEELSLVAQGLACNTNNFANWSGAFMERVRIVVSGIMFAHSGMLTGRAKACLSGQYTCDLMRLAHLSQDDIILPGHTRQYFREIYLRNIHPILLSLVSQDHVGPEELSNCLIRLSLAGLELMVPDKIMDPAVFPNVSFQLHQRRVAELESRIAGQTKFHQLTMGQDTSMVIRTLRSALSDLGSVSPPPTVLRPDRSELNKIQETFTRITQGLLSSQPSHDDEVINSEWVQQWTKEQGQLNLRAMIERLEGADRTYDDFVKPILWFLKCFSHGIDLIAARVNKQHDEGVISKIARHAPMLGAQPDNLQLWDVTSESGSNLQWLEFVAMDSSLMPKNSFTVSQRLLGVLDHFYLAWKTHLTKDQAEAAVQSRYYTYRGDAATETDDELRELQEMFPEFVDQTTELEKPDSKYDARAIAVKLATLHEKIYALQDPQLTLRSYTLGALEEIAKHSNHQSDIASTFFIDLLPAILIQMEERMAALHGTNRTQHLNIYSDSDLAEYEKLFTLVHQVQARFHTIAERWPEHAVPAEVLAYCNEVFYLNLGDPVAKFMTKTEKLYEIVSQWQSVASREWSVAPLIDQLSALIVRWRRLELFSWAGLLDEEKCRHEQDAQAWYFIAYESVLHNSARILAAGEDMQLYCKDLARTLEGFFKTTSLGQYSSRLKLLDTFNHTLKDIAKQDPGMLSVHSCVSNLIEHYRRYEPGIETTLRTGRASLEKALKEQIQLASWKDTNIAALRDSARRSHHKLFKIVRKYRDLLNQAVTISKPAAESVGELTATTTELDAAEPFLNISMIQDASVKCGHALPDWNTRPARLTDTIGAVKSMRHLYTKKTTELEAQLELASLRDDLKSAIKQLRSETPSALTEENAASVRHLQERKRRLLADTLKTVSQMGIRRNLPTSELEKQSSAALILASSPGLLSNGRQAIASQATAVFHDLLDLMSQVRAGRTKHSEDLTEGEVGRSMGLLEGLLCVILNQRQAIASSGESSVNLETQLALSRSCLTQAPNQLSNSSGSQEGDPSLTRHLAWLAEVLTLSCRILTFQAQHAKIDLDQLLDCLRNYITRIRGHKSDLEQLPGLPLGLNSRIGDSSKSQSLQTLSELAVVLREWQSKEPRVDFVLRQLVPWTENLQALQQVKENGVRSTSLSSWDDHLRTLIDQIFVALQKWSSVQEDTPNSIEEQGWLTKIERCAVQGHRAMQVNSISASIGSLLGNLHSLDSNDFIIACDLLQVASPVLEQFYHICLHLHSQQVAVHLETCRLALQLATSFDALLSQGFCRPSEPSQGEEQSGKLESGTGLGEGEGAEDISKDVAEDEDLSELAQTGQKEDREDEMENAEDAVDMGMDDLEGDMGDKEEEKSDDEGQGRSDEEEGDDDIDEETGSVDDLDPNAVDEKMWDDMKNESEDKEMKNDKAEGKKSDDQTAADGEKGEGEDMEGQEGEEQVDEDDGEEGEGAERPEAENMDPHTDNQDALELPEELQLAGEEEVKDDNISDDGVDEMSDIDQSADEIEDAELDDVEKEEKSFNEDAGVQDDVDQKDEVENGVGQDDEIMEDQEELDEDENEIGEHRTRDDDTAQDQDEPAGGDTGAADTRQDTNDHQQQQDAQAMNDAEQEPNPEQSRPGKAPENQEQGETGKGAAELGAGRTNEVEHQQNEALRKLADVLDQWHNRREILSASEENLQTDMKQDIDMADVDFEHVQDEEDEGDAQALGAATGEQAQQNLDQSKAIEDEDMAIDQDVEVPDVLEPEVQDNIAERLNRLQQAQMNAGEEAKGSGAFLPSQERGINRHSNDQQEDVEAAQDDMLSDVEDVDNLGHHDDNVPAAPSPPTSTADAAQLWNQCSAATHQFSLVLTEQLRLILSPTTATKLRGDYRTGKRLNIKRIIPYIASSYKRDKIWMRRSVPSKRNYQIMIAVDDSRSMAESGADLLAFETLAMLTKALSMLESGEICVVGFGDGPHVRVAHPFGTPFSPAESGPHVFRSFGFDQRGTDVRNLVEESIRLFRDARLKGGHAASEDLWQLQLIVSDGHCSDHQGIARLVRQAQQEKIIVVFVIVDAGRDSILDLQEAVYEPDPAAAAAGGQVEMRLRTKRYLEDFPFPYYLVVRDVRDLPGVLATALKGWFGSVVDVQ